MEKPAIGNAGSRTSKLEKNFDIPGLAEYTGAWEAAHVAQLLKRTLFGCTFADLNYFFSLGMSQAVDEILTPTAAPSSVPLNNYNTDPTGVAPWASWITSGINYVNSTMNANRVDSMRCWWIGQMLNGGRSIHEKMTLFWHNHFATDAGAHIADIPAALWYYQYMTLRKNALGSFKQMVHDITLDPAMLIFLNGSTNAKTAPNENYGRELQELYTQGKGVASLYTEADVFAAARVLTGHSVDANFNYIFNAGNHDDQNKSFSNYYGGTMITGRSGASGAAEVDDLMNMLFSTTESAKFICRKIYNFFVYYNIDANIESTIITPLAQIFQNSGYNITAVMSTLLKSEHFNDLAYAGACVIKSPLDFILGLVREFGVALPALTDNAGSYTCWEMLLQHAATLQQEILGIPVVAGWYPYYESPAYHELWINSVTYTERNAYTDLMISTGDMMNTLTMIIDPIAFAQQLSNPSDPNILISDSLNVLYRVPLSDASIVFLKQSILLSGQTNDYYWTNAWNAYIANPTDMVTKETILTRLQSLYKYLMDLPEYQLA